MRIAFLGSPDFSVPILRALHTAHEIVCVYSQPPRPSGRGQKMTPCPVHKAALDLGLPVRNPINFKADDERAFFASLALDTAVVAAYGIILPSAILDQPTHGCLNVHASLLPRWRGASPIQSAILAGDTQTGITIMHMEKGLDTGPIMLMAATPITNETTASSLHDTLSEIGATLIIDALASMPTPVPQTGDSIYAAKLAKENEKIDWKRSVAQIDRQIRALNPWPGTYCTIGTGEILKILAAHPASPESRGFVASCGDGMLVLDRVQRAGKPPMSGDDFLRGYHGDLFLS
jgi:methionyl-tRNA formyltransferase